VNLLCALIRLCCATTVCCTYVYGLGDDAVIPGPFNFVSILFIYLFIFVVVGLIVGQKKITGAMGISGLIREDPGIRIISVGP